jgi:fructokinase
MRVLAFGEILWDIINGEEHLGGAPFNFAAHVSRCGNESHIVSRVGDDFRGMKAYNRCKEYGVDHSLVQWDEQHATGVVEVKLNEGQPDYTIIKNVAFDFIEVNDVLKALDRKRFDVFYFGSLIQRNVTSATTLEYILKEFVFSHIFYDVNLRKDGYTASIIKQSLQWCTILKLNIDELPLISAIVFDEAFETEDFCRALQSRYSQISTIVVTASEKGCYVYDHAKFDYVEGKKVTVNDAVGAGDAFSAAFMHALANGFTARDAAVIANQLGAYVTTQRGAIPSYSDEIKELLKPKQVTRHASKIIL